MQQGQSPQIPELHRQAVMPTACFPEHWRSDTTTFLAEDARDHHAEAGDRAETC